MLFFVKSLLHSRTVVSHVLCVHTMTSVLLKSITIQNEPYAIYFLNNYPCLIISDSSVHFITGKSLSLYCSLRVITRFSS